MKAITLGAVAALMIMSVTARAQAPSADAAPSKSAIGAYVLDSCTRMSP